MKTKPLLGLAILLAGLAVFSQAAAEQEPAPATIEVLGKAAVQAQPNIAVIAFAAESSRARAGEAVKENARQAEALLGALRPLLGPEDKLQTSRYNLHPIYDKGSHLKPSGYRVVNQVVVHTRLVDKVGDFVDAATAAGAGGIGSLQFQTDKAAEHSRQAAALAVEQARKNAEELAQAAGVAVKRVLQIRYTPQRPAVRLMAEAAVARAQTPIEPGELTIEAEVIMVFEIE